MQDAVDEVADQFGLHRQVHGHPLGAQLIELDAEHLIEGNALEETGHRLLQVGAEDEGLGHGRGSGKSCRHAAVLRKTWPEAMQECPEHWPDRPDSCGRIRVRSASASVSMSVG